MHAVAALPHYRAHLEPIVSALGGRFVSPQQGARLPLVLVASHRDARLVRRYVLVEHGAGQSYPADPLSARHPSYPGGRGHDHCALFLVPGPAAGQAWRAAYPSTPVVEVGSPRLDGIARATGDPVAVFAWHWECGVTNETRTALPHYRDHLERIGDQLRAAGVEPVGSAHPRAFPKVEPLYRKMGWRTIASGSEVLATASVLVADNTSAMYEAAALDVPVVALNAPWYRRDVHHGLRFWDAVPGPMVDYYGDVAPAVLEALSRPQGHAGLRSAAVAAAYAHVDGRATKRAVVAVTGLR